MIPGIYCYGQGSYDGLVCGHLKRMYRSYEETKFNYLGHKCLKFKRNIKKNFCKCDACLKELTDGEGK